MYKQYKDLSRSERRKVTDFPLDRAIFVRTGVGYCFVMDGEKYRGILTSKNRQKGFIKEKEDVAFTRLCRTFVGRHVGVPPGAIESKVA